MHRKFLESFGLGLVLWTCSGVLLAQDRGTVPDERPLPTIATATLKVGAQERSYVLYVPVVRQPRPALLLVFHGAGGEGASMRRETGYEFERLADAQGFVVAYPNGYAHSWNDCRKLAPYRAKQEDIDDVGFVRALVKRLESEQQVDAQKVFALGYSNGAQLAYRLAIEAPDLVHGVAGIAANLPATDNFDCAPASRAVAVLIMNGTADPVNPYEGGRVRLGLLTSAGNVLSAQQSAQFFVQRAGLDGHAIDSQVQTAVVADKPSASLALWQAPGKPSVALYTIHHGGHAIPQREFTFPRVLGPTDHAFDGPAVIWDFFKASLPP